ncbi:Imm61 family immunity protein [Mycolicibacterium goodii]|uniref:Imm61 family immunity protein n=1 Tax=Mycolicibacterium goodii TaxID=134601 RepID=UPI0009FAB239
MTDNFTLSDPLIECATRAGYDVTQGTGTSDGRAILSTNLGELRYFVENTADGWTTVSDSDRLGPENFIFAGRSTDVTERYLFTKLGGSARDNLGVPKLKFPISREKVAAGYSIDNSWFRDEECLVLVTASDADIAVSGAGTLMGTLELVRLSYHMNHSLETILCSYFDPSGSPLFEDFLAG